MFQDTSELSSSRQLKFAAQMKARSGSNGIVPKQDTLSNGARNFIHDYNEVKEKVLVHFPNLTLIYVSTLLIH